MKTVVYSILDPKTRMTNIIKAAEVIKNGGLVAFPTETVYGLGANALDESACAKIYAVKGRPSDNPLIMHISSNDMVDSLAKNISPAARKLINALWPGSLTIVFQSNVPRGTYFHTVALRMPKNMLARVLIHHAEVPIAAPSANISGRPSPTTAAHVLEDLGGKIDMILDGGPCEVGLESTVIDCSGDMPTILRPGAVTREMIEKQIGPVDMISEVGPDEAPKSPGMKYKHYAPQAKLTIVVGETAKARAKLDELAKAAQGKKVKIMTAEDMGGSYGAIAANLFDMLRKCDEEGLEEVFVEAVDEEGLGVAIMNRLKKAASYNIVKV